MRRRRLTSRAMRICTSSASPGRSWPSRWLPLDWNGERAWRAQVIDITERKRSEEALHPSRQRFEALFHNPLVPQPVSDPGTAIVDDAIALKEIVDEVLLAHRPMLKTSPTEIRTDVPAGIRLDSYPGPLGQVLGNQITNAVLHGYEGRAQGVVNVQARVDGEDMDEIAVIDHGRGIPEADQKKVFDPFFATRLGRGGTGLGLGICHNIVTKTLGGSVQVLSRPDEGATFIVRIPPAAPSFASDQEAA